MFKIDLKRGALEVSLSKEIIRSSFNFFDQNSLKFILIILLVLSLSAFTLYYINHLGLSYNDARSHLDIGRRVVEGLKPGLAQLGSVWLPLPHILMLPTIWSDFMWHTGLSGALVSMIGFVATGALVYMTLRALNTGLYGRIIGVIVFAFNINVLYLQSTAMTELLLMVTTAAAVYFIIQWSKDNRILNLIKASFWVMLASLTRYDGWFLLVSDDLQ